ncbi:hypothetical protein Goari_013433, partial [Gossypium aridum]|nr:hypothetical protein [Gossypium aridum]
PEAQKIKTHRTRAIKAQPSLKGANPKHRCFQPPSLTSEEGGEWLERSTSSGLLYPSQQIHHWKGSKRTTFIPVETVGNTDGCKSIAVGRNAKSDADFRRLSSNGIYEAVELQPLIPHLISSDDLASILALQITLFPSQGFSFGITAHHIILEGKTTSMDMTSSKILKGLTDLDVLYLNQWLTITIGNKSLKAFNRLRSVSESSSSRSYNSPEDFNKMRRKVYLLRDFKDFENGVCLCCNNTVKGLTEKWIFERLCLIQGASRICTNYNSCWIASIWMRKALESGGCFH